MSNSTSPSSNSSSAPAAPPPDGVTPNFDDPQDVYYTANLAITITCLAVVNLLFLIHVYVKWRVKRGTVLPEDGFCISAWVLVNVFLASTLMRSIHGEGRPIWEISRGHYKQFLKWLYLGSSFYSPAAFCTKATLLLLIGRVFSVKPFVSKWIRIFILILFLAYIPIGGLKIFICHPVSAYWEAYETSGLTGNNPKCFEQSILFMCDILIAIITDSIILILPIPLVWSMETSWRRKIKIIVLLGAGGAATATTMMRAYFNVHLMNSSNTTVDFTLSSMTTSLELAIGLSCACLPSANLLFEKIIHSVGFPSFRSLSRETQIIPDARKSSNATTSSHWSSLVSKITARTMTLTTRSNHDSHVYSTRRTTYPDYDVEMGSQMSPVVVIFNNPLDVPSIRSTSDEISRTTSREEVHRRPSGPALEDSLEVISQESEKRNGRSGRKSPLDRDRDNT